MVAEKNKKKIPVLFFKQKHIFILMAIFVIVLWYHTFSTVGDVILNLITYYSVWLFFSTMERIELNPANSWRKLRYSNRL